MENKRMAILVVIMLVMGNMIIETEAMPFKVCYKGCLAACEKAAHGFIPTVMCPVTCFKTCRQRSSPSPPPTFETSLKQIDQTEYFCNLGCATDRCLSSFSIDDKDHVDKVSVCADSCSETCSHNK